MARWSWRLPWRKEHLLQERTRELRRGDEGRKEGEGQRRGARPAGGSPELGRPEVARGGTRPRGSGRILVTGEKALAGARRSLGSSSEGGEGELRAEWIWLVICSVGKTRKVEKVAAAWGFDGWDILRFRVWSKID